MHVLGEPNQKISGHALQVWRLSGVIQETASIIIVLGLLVASYLHNWYTWIQVILWIIIIVTPLSMIWTIWLDPKLKLKYWRYRIDEHYVQLKFGWFNKHLVVIPMTKVQYVEAEQGPLLRRYGLYSLTVGTIGSTHKIPALSEEEAFKLRAYISHHANLEEEE